MTWLPLTRPDKGKVWLNSKADFWRITENPSATYLVNDRPTKTTDIWCGDVMQTVLESPEQIIAMLEKSQ